MFQTFRPGTRCLCDATWTPPRVSLPSHRASTNPQISAAAMFDGKVGERVEANVYVGCVLRDTPEVGSPEVGSARTYGRIRPRMPRRWTRVRATGAVRRAGVGFSRPQRIRPRERADGPDLLGRCGPLGGPVGRTVGNAKTGSATCEAESGQAFPRDPATPDFGPSSRPPCLTLPRGNPELTPRNAPNIYTAS